MHRTDPILCYLVTGKSSASLGMAGQAGRQSFPGDKLGVHKQAKSEGQVKASLSLPKGTLSLWTVGRQEGFPGPSHSHSFSPSDLLETGSICQHLLQTGPLGPKSLIPSKMTASLCRGPHLSLIGVHGGLPDSSTRQLQHQRNLSLANTEGFSAQFYALL